MKNSNALAKQLSRKYGIELSAAEVDENGLYNVTVSGKNEMVLGASAQPRLRGAAICKASQSRKA